MHNFKQLHNWRVVNNKWILIALELWAEICSIQQINTADNFLFQIELFHLQITQKRGCLWDDVVPLEKRSKFCFILKNAWDNKRYYQFFHQSNKIACQFWCDLKSHLLRTSIMSYTWGRLGNCIGLYSVFFKKHHAGWDQQIHILGTTGKTKWILRCLPGAL